MTFGYQTLANPPQGKLANSVTATGGGKTATSSVSIDQGFVKSITMDGAGTVEVNEPRRADDPKSSKPQSVTTDGSVTEMSKFNADGTFQKYDSTGGTDTCGVQKLLPSTNEDRKLAFCCVGRMSGSEGS